MFEGESRLAIIDPVGAKAGMDYYNDGLMSGMALLGVDGYIFSNYEGADARATYVRCFNQNRITNVRDVLGYLSGFFKAASKCRKKKIKTVFLHQFSSNWLVLIGFLIVKVSGLRIITIAHDITSFAGDDNNLWRNVIYNRLSDHISVHNIFSRNAILPFLKEPIRRRVYLARHGDYLDCVSEDIDRNHAREKLGMRKNRKYLLFFGQIKKVKGLELLVESMELVDEEVDLLIAGMPWRDCGHFYENLIETHKLAGRVVCHFRYIEDYERDMMFKACDALVLPYTRIYESGVLLMGLSYGLPVVASKIAPFDAIVGKHSLGALYEPGSAQDLAVAINKVCASASSDDTRNRSVNYIKKHHLWKDVAVSHLENIFE